MKTPPKKPSNPNSIARPSALRVHLLRLTGFSVGLSALLALFALLVVGLPPGLTRRITTEIQQAGIPLQIQSIRLSTHRGWVLHQVRLYSPSPDDLQPLLSAEKLYVGIWPANWIKPTSGGWHINLYVKNLRLSLGHPWDNELPGTNPFRTLNRVEASLTATPGQLLVKKAELRWGTLHLRTHGTARFSAGNQPLSWDETASLRRYAAQLADALSELKCKEAPQLHLTFHYDHKRPEETILEADLHAENLTWKDRSYAQLSGTLDCRDTVCTLSALRLSRSDHEQLLLRGAFDLRSGTAQASVENTLSAADLFSVLPEQAQTAIAQTGIKPYGRCDFTASAGPSPYRQLAEHLNIQLQHAQIKRQDLTLDPLALRLRRNGNQIQVTEIQAQVNGGPLSGRFEFDLHSNAWNAAVQAQCDLAPLGTLIGGDFQTFIQRFHFPTEPPQADILLSQTNFEAPLFLSGTLSANHFTCGGVPIGHLETHITYSNEVLDLTPLHIVREQERLDGSVQIDFIRHLAFFNATNRFPPSDIARALAPNTHTILEQIRCHGPVYSTGHGQVDYLEGTNHHFTGTVRAENIELGHIQADLFHTDIEGRGTQLHLTNTTAQLYNGQLQSHAEFNLSQQDGQAPYSITAKLTQLELAQLLKQRSTNHSERAHGQLTATLHLTADAKDNFWPSARGEGTVVLENGRLADLPLFGGFSRLIQTAFSGFTLFSLTTFSADYQLHDGAFWSENAQLGGTLISARGRGHYSVEKGLDFRVTAEPLRQPGNQNKEWYPIQRLAATATAPLLRLLEFELKGPLEKPDWRFVNLPQ